MVEIFDNILQLYKFQAPCAQLSGWIEFFSESSAEETTKQVAGEPFTIRLFPSWTPTIWFNLGCPYHLITGAEIHEVQTDTDVLILRGGITERRNLPLDHIFTVKFCPGGLEKILGVSQETLTAPFIELKNILPIPLIHAVRRATGLEERVHLLEQYFVEQSETKKPLEHRILAVKEAVAHFESTGLRLKNKKIAEETYTSSKTMNRYFQSVVGAGPKHYFTALRTRRALVAYLGNRKDFLPDEFGYYDLSHFYKDVVKFTGRRLPSH